VCKLEDIMRGGVTEVRRTITGNEVDQCGNTNSRLNRLLQYSSASFVMLNVSMLVSPLLSAR